MWKVVVTSKDTGVEQARVEDCPDEAAADGWIAQHWADDNLFIKDKTDITAELAAEQQAKNTALQNQAAAAQYLSLAPAAFQACVTIDDLKAAIIALVQDIAVLLQK